MKWKKSQYSETLNLGLIVATVQWDILYGKGYVVNVNDIHLDPDDAKVYKTANDAKIVAERYIKYKINKILNIENILKNHRNETLTEHTINTILDELYT